MSEFERGQVSRHAAEVYEEFFVPALFQEWAPRVVRAAGIKPCQRVLDVACGTGVLAQAVAARVGLDGSVAGVDLNEGMLAVARRKAPEIDWRRGSAESLPFDRGNFDAVVSQFGLMFFENRVTALREMFRVSRPGGMVAVAVWDSLENTPGYAAVTELLERLFGHEPAGALRAPYSLGDRQRLSSLFSDAGVDGAEIKTYEGTARFPSIRSWMYTDVKGWTLADMITEAQFDLLAREADEALAQFVTSNGTVAFSAPAHIVTAIKT